jgi:hypothetical protein
MRGLQPRADADYSPRISLNREKVAQAVAEVEAFVAQVRVFVEHSDSWTFSSPTASVRGVAQSR